MTQGGATTRPVRILVVEKDEALRLKAAGALESAGYEVAIAVDAMDGLKKLYETYPDLIIVARELPKVNGEDAYLRIRQASYLPIIVIGNREEAAEMLELGADAYVAKPPSLGELVARVRALLRRKPRQEPPGGNILATRNHPPNDGNGWNKLTPTEFRLASCLLCNKGRLLGYSELISRVWGGKKVSLDNLHFHMRRLRQKLADGGISMLRGVGYCFCGDSQ
jgi:DNA-binding response OmpR family regulator